MERTFKKVDYIIPAITSNPVEVFFTKDYEETAFQKDYKKNQNIWDNILSDDRFVACQFEIKSGNVYILAPSTRISGAWQLSRFDADLQAIGHSTFAFKNASMSLKDAHSYQELLSELTIASREWVLHIVASYLPE